MVPRYVTPELGLLNATGEGLAIFLRTAYDLPAQWRSEPTWLTVRHLVGPGPVLLGGRRWNHWTAVRYANKDGTLALANPSPRWRGVGDTLDAQEWAVWGSWSVVWLE